MHKAIPLSAVVEENVQGSPEGGTSKPLPPYTHPLPTHPPTSGHLSLLCCAAPHPSLPPFLPLRRNEDYKHAAKEHMQAVFQFLGVRNLSDEEWGPVIAMPAKNVGKKR